MFSQHLSFTIDPCLHTEAILVSFVFFAPWSKKGLTAFCRHLTVKTVFKQFDSNDPSICPCFIISYHLQVMFQRKLELDGPKIAISLCVLSCTCILALPDGGLVPSLMWPYQSAGLPAGFNGSLVPVPCQSFPKVFSSFCLSTVFLLLSPSCFVESRRKTGLAPAATHGEAVATISISQQTKK